MLNDALRIVRLIHDYKSIELAKELGISASYLSEIENGKKKPSLELLQKYSDVLDLRPSTLLFFSEELDKNKAGDRVKSKMRNHVIALMKKIETQDDFNYEKV